MVDSTTRAVNAGHATLTGDIGLMRIDLESLHIGMRSHI